MKLEDLKGFHWADGGRQRIGLIPVESVYTNGKPWTSSWRANLQGGAGRANNLAYITMHGDHYEATYYSGFIHDEERWTQMAFEPERTLEEVQAAVEAILKLSE